MDIPRWKWRNREQLIQEIDARGRIHDIQFVYKLKDMLEVRWWEPLLKIFVMVAGVGFAVTLVHLLDLSVDLYSALQMEREGATPLENPEATKIVFWFIAGAFSLMLISALVSLEIMLSRVNAMRRLHQIQLRVIENLQTELEEIRESLPKPPGDAADKPDS